MAALKLYLSELKLPSLTDDDAEAQTILSSGKLICTSFLYMSNIQHTSNVIYLTSHIILYIQYRQHTTTYEVKEVCPCLNL